MFVELISHAGKLFHGEPELGPLFGVHELGQVGKLHGLGPLGVQLIHQPPPFLLHSGQIVAEAELAFAGLQKPLVLAGEQDIALLLDHFQKVPESLNLFAQLNLDKFDNRLHGNCSLTDFI
jgi:hypothetical protein